MKNLFTFVIGMLVGAIAALLLAPERGDDLRLQLQERAGQDINRMQKLWKEDMAKMSDQLSILQSQFIAMQNVADQQVVDGLENSSEQSSEQIDNV
jgi:gas vesicle protein